MGKVHLPACAVVRLSQNKHDTTVASTYLAVNGKQPNRSWVALTALRVFFSAFATSCHVVVILVLDKHFLLFPMPKDDGCLVSVIFGETSLVLPSHIRFVPDVGSHNTHHLLDNDLV